MKREEKEIKKKLLEEMKQSKVDLNENEQNQIISVLSFMKNKIQEQDIKDTDEIAILIEDYINLTVSFIDYQEECSCEESENTRYDTPYAALVMKRSSTLGVARAVRLMLKVLDIDSRIEAFHNYVEDYSNYLVAIDATDEDYEDGEGEAFYTIDPYNSVLAYKNFVSKKTLYDRGDFLDMENIV